MSILPFVVIDGGPYRQRLLSASPPWRPPPTRLSYSSKHATGTHNKPFIKACFWSRFEKTKVAIRSWICLCVCERDREKERVWEQASCRIKEKNLVSSVLSHISRVQRLVSATKRFPETIYWMTVGMSWAGIFWHCEFPWYFFLIWAMWFVSSGIQPSTEPIHLYIKRFIMRNQLILLWELAEQLQNL